VLSQLAFDLPSNIPSQENDSSRGQMNLDVGSDTAAEWARSGDVLMLLQKLLVRPFDDVLGIRSVLPFGGLLDRHIVQLDALASDLKAHFDVDHNSSVYTMHVWLFHLLGGRHAGLTPPTDDKRAPLTKAVATVCSRHAQRYNEKCVELRKSARKQAGADTRLAPPSVFSVSGKIRNTGIRTA